MPAYAIPICDIRFELSTEPDQGLAGILHLEGEGTYGLMEFDAFDQWVEEEQVISGHPRDPYHRIDVRLSSRRVRVEFAGMLIAESRSPLMLFETGVHPRVYIPRLDVRLDLLARTATRTYCAYKGDASYLSLAAGDELVGDIAWTYEQPLCDATDIAGCLSFYEDRVDVILDGHRVTHI